MLWKKRGKSWKLADAQKVGTLSLANMNLREKAELAQFYYNQFHLRENTYTPAAIPYAYLNLAEQFERASKSDRLTDLQRQISLDAPIVVQKGKKRELNYPFSEMDNPNASLNSYIRRMQSFFSAKTSTTSGWLEVGKMQDIALFGGHETGKYHFARDENGKFIKDKNGKRVRVYEIEPNNRLTDDERRQLWRIIDMAKDAGWLNRFGYDSGQAHRELASLWQSGELRIDDIELAEKRIQEIMNDKEARRGRYADVTQGIPGNPIPHNAESGDNIEWSSQPDLLSQDDSF